MDEDTWTQLDAAAEAIGRSSSTVRRWIRLGHVESMPGPIPASGGRPISLVRMTDVRAFASGSTRASVHDPVDSDPRVAWELEHASAALSAATAELNNANAEVERLRQELSNLRVELARTAAEHAAMNERVSFLAAREATEREGRELALSQLMAAMGARPGTHASDRSDT